MNFYIKHIKLWFNSHPEPITYDFEPNKVNVITGDSSTGKSSILRIIDYCLLSKESYIVEEVINDNVAWYGLNFHLNGHNYTIARKAPRGRDEHSIYWAEADELPKDVPVPNVSNRHQLLSQFNELFGVPEVKYAGFKDRIVSIDFRHFLLFNYLTEDIIATSNSYFDTKFFNDVNYDLLLDNFLKLAIGVDDAKFTELTEEGKQIAKKISEEIKNKEEDANAQTTYNKGIEEVSIKARQLGLVPDSLFPTQQDLMDCINQGIERFNQFVKRKREQNKVTKLENQERKLKSVVRSYEATLKEYQKTIDYSTSVKDSMSPIEFLKQHLNMVSLSPDSVELFKSLEDAYDSVKNVSMPIVSLPKDFEERHQEVSRQLKDVQLQLKPYREIKDRLYNQTWLWDVLKLQEKLKKLKVKPAKYCGDRKLQEMQERSDFIEKSKDAIKIQNENCLKNMIDSISVYFAIQKGIDDKYRNCQLGFDEDMHTLQLSINDERNYKLVKQMGSKSNFMFLHLCFYLGLHEYLKTREQSIVPNFLFIDQPSIPYYGNTRKKVKEEKEEDAQISNNLRLKVKTDEEKLKNAFSLINNFMSQNVNAEKNECFQIIMVEHADPEYWDGLSYFHNKYIFTEEKDYGLIPRYVTGE